MHTTFTDWF